MCDAGANGFMHKRPFGVCLLQSATLALVQSSMHLDRNINSKLSVRRSVDREVMHVPGVRASPPSA